MPPTAHSRPNAVIRITNLRLRTFIGFNPEEREKRQDVVVNIEIHYPFTSAIREDKVESAFNYKTITKAVIQHVEEGRFLLLEKLVADILAICSDSPAVRYCRVTVDKPFALRFADSVSLSLDYYADAMEKQS